MQHALLSLEILTNHRTHVMGVAIIMSDLLLVEVGGRGDVSAGAGGGGEAGGVVHHGVPGHAPRPRHVGRHVVVGGRVPALLVLVN